jgi:Peptidase family M28
MRASRYRQAAQDMSIAFGVFLAVAWGQPWRLLAQGPAPASGVRYAQISENDLREWLSYLASDELQGRQVFTEGYGRATQYVADQLKSWGVKPIGEKGTYLQPVKLKGYRVTRNSTVTIEAGGQSRTFKHGDHVTFSTGSGGKQSLTFNGVEFLGYGLPADYQGRDVKGKLIVAVPNLAPVTPQRGAPAVEAAPAAAAAGGRGGRGGTGAGLTQGATAAITFAPTPAAPSAADQALAQALTALNQANAAVTQAQQALRGRGGQGGRGGGNPAAAGARGAQTADVTTVVRVDSIVTPSFTGDETFFETLFAGSSTPFADIRAKAEKGEAIDPMSLAAKVTINIDNTFEVISEQITHNVVGMVEGTDPALKDTYVLVGAHLDHVGYSQTGGGRGSGTDACRRRGPAAQAAVVAAGKVVQRPTPARGAGGGAGGGGGRGDGAPAGRGAAVPAVPLDQRDLVSNGADDDGSGSASALAVAKAFATGPKPKRSVVFVWHAGEESGLYGSRYNADFPIVPLEKVQAQLNMDMVGRDDCDNIEGDYTNTLFLVGADRISTDLHNLVIQTNATFAKPLTLDYELNDTNDPENVYTRSDHYSYASKGIPIVFFTTGLHPDYHRITDSVDKIQFPKMTRIAQLVYEVGFSIADSPKTLERDNKGARTGFGSKAEILPK